MKVLIIKMSSMGDILHTLPALTDAHHAYPNIEFSWVVEEGFAEIPAWHPAVKKIIPIAWRRWRKHLFTKKCHIEIKEFLAMLREESYDLIIDAQGLLKSALVAKLAKGPRAGYDWSSAREKIASIFYQRHYSISTELHAIERIRQLFAQALSYSITPSIRYGLSLQANSLHRFELPETFLLFIPNTSSHTKYWPIHHWRELIEICKGSNLSIVIPSGYAKEKPMIQEIAANFVNVKIVENTSLIEIASITEKALGVVSVDTGLSHLAAALEKPTIIIYGPTNPEKIGTRGPHQIPLRNADNKMESINATQVWTQIKSCITPLNY